MHLNLPDKRYYGMGEVAEAFKVNTSLIRFWEKEFDVIKPKKNAKGNVIKNKKHNGLKSIKSFNFSLIIFNEVLSSKKCPD